MSFRKHGSLYLAKSILPKRFITADGSNMGVFVKIGVTTSKNPQAIANRLQSYQAGNQFDIIKVRSYPIIDDDPYLHQLYLHKTLEEDHENGWWYYISQEKLDFIEKSLHDRLLYGKPYPDEARFMKLQEEKKAKKKKKIKNNSTEQPSKSHEVYIKEKATSILKNHTEAILKKKKANGVTWSQLEEDESNLLNIILQKHPDTDKLIGNGILSIFIAESPIENLYCFHVLRKDGSIEEFSYILCFPPVVGTSQSMQIQIVSYEMAIENHNTVEMNYYCDKDQKDTFRRIEPLSTYSIDGMWFVIGWCHLRSAYCTFRMDKIINYQILHDETFEDRHKFDLKAYLQTNNQVE